MQVKRYLVVTVSGDDMPAILELPHKTLQSAWEALQSEFERTVQRVFGKSILEEIEYTKDGSAEGYKRGKEYSLEEESEGGPYFHVRGGTGPSYDGVIQEVTVELSEDEVEKAYRVREQQYLHLDAEAHLYDYLGYDRDAKDGSEEAAENAAVRQKFEDDYGFTLSEAVDVNSDFFVLDDMAALFERKRDCNEDENSTWDWVVRACLYTLKAGAA